jgi:hypothetical protein
LFTRELLDRQTADIVIPPLAELHRPARGIVGVDFGVSHDRCAAVGLYRLPVSALNPQRSPKPVFVALPWVWSQGYELNRFVDELVRSLASFRYVSPEVNGVGAYPSTELRRRAAQSSARVPWTWNMVNTTASSKTTGYGTILGLLEQEQLVLPREPALLRQLAGLKFEQRERGFTHIEAGDGVAHDDVSDALYLAALPHKPPQAHRVICELARFAGSSRAPADARVPEIECPVVSTGGGLRLHERPTLQSVITDNFSLYAPPVDAKPEGFRSGRFFVKSTQGAVNV